MIMNLYCVKDELSEKTDLFLEENDATAKRSFEFAIKNDLKKAMFAKNYDLYFLGKYDSATISFEIVAPKLIVQGSSVLRSNIDEN